MVCSDASTVGFNPSSRSALVVSGPMEANFNPGSSSKHLAKPKRVSKFFTAELLANVIQSAPSSSNDSAAPLRSSVSGTVL